MSQYDITSGTPSGMPSGPRASVGIRFVALLIDGVILVVIQLVLRLLVGEALSQLIGLVLGIAYFAYFEGQPAGQTPGKKVMNIRVIAFDTGGPIDSSRALIRSLVRVVSGFACFIGYIWALFNKENQTWHDLAARTVVVPTSAYPVP